MTEVERCFKAFEDSRERGETVSAFHFFHAGWKQGFESGAKEVTQLSAKLDSAVRILGDNQDDCYPNKCTRGLKCTQHAKQVCVDIPCCTCDGCIDDGYQCIHNYCSAHASKGVAKDEK